MATAGTVNIDITASTISLQQGVKKSIGLLESMERQIKSSGINKIGEILRAGGMVAGFNAIARGLEDATAKAIELRQQLREGAISSNEMMLSLTKSLPVLGHVTGFAENLAELFTGAGQALKDAEATNQTFWATVQSGIAVGKQMQQQMQDVADTVQKIRAESILAGLTGDERAIAQIGKQVEAEAESNIKRIQDATAKSVAKLDADIEKLTAAREKGRGAGTDTQQLTSQIADLQRQKFAAGQQEQQQINAITTALDGKRKAEIAAFEASRQAAIDDKVIQGLMDQQKGIADFVKALEDQAAALRMTNEEQQLAKLSAMGANEEQLAQARAALESAKAWHENAKALEAFRDQVEEASKAQEELARSGESVFEATRTPLERLMQRVEELQRIFEGGGIDSDTMRRALDMAEKDFQSAGGGNRNGLGPETFASREIRFGEGFKANTLGGGPQKTLSEQLDVLKAVRDKLGKIESKFSPFVGDEAEVVDI